jgi:hypothetical protein
VFQTPLRIVHLIGQGFGRKMSIQGRPSAWLPEPRMEGYHFQVIKEFHRTFGGLKPKVPVNQAKWCGIVNFFKLHMAIAVEFDFSPGGKLRGAMGKGLKLAAFSFDKSRKWFLFGGPVGAISGLFYYPADQLLIGIGEGAKHSQGQEIAFKVFDSGFNPPFLLRVARRTRGDEKAIALSTFGIGTLHLRVTETGFGNSTLGIIDDDFSGDAAEKLEGPAVAP